MMFKIDTKEKFKVIRLEEKQLTANMTDNLRNLLLNCLKEPVPNIILNLELVENISPETAEMLQQVQQEFYNSKHSFVICSLLPMAESQLDEYGILELLNVTPTESEAWDIIQMEEIERELLGDEDDFE